MKLWTIGLFIACGAIVTAAHAQTGNASISGQINDPSGAVIPGAQVSIRNVATNVTHSTLSSADGRFSVTSLIPGEYTLTASFQGFRTAERGGLVLRVGDRLALDIALEVGSAADRVTVTAEVPLIRTEDAQAGLVIENRRIQDLPQYNRDPLAFVFLTPNVSGSNQNDLRINGSRSKQIEYFIDGVPVTTGYLHDVPPSVPSREAIAEFKVITNGLSAEYGRLSGGAVQVISRSGTNQYHGSVYEFFRNDKLNASDWNTNRFGREKGVFHDNVFGGTFGGPVSIPKLYNGRDRTFFFLNYEGTRRRTGNNVALGSVPTELERQGDFSQSVLDGGTPVQIFDPLTSRIDGARVRRDPFPGNRVPQSRFDALASIYIGYYPQPNRPPLPGSNNEGNFIGSVSNPADNNRWTGRVDQNWSARHSTHATVSYFDSNSGNTRWYGALQPVNVTRGEAYTVSLDHTVALAPSMILNLRGGVVRAQTFSGNEVDTDAGGWNLPAQVLNLLGTTSSRVPNLGTGSHIMSLGGGNVNDARDTSYTGSISFQKLWSKHTFKFGWEHRRYYSNVTNGGSFSLATERRVTSQFYDNPVTGHPMAGFLLGIASWGQGVQVAGPASLQAYQGAYLQDDWKITPKLTINLGLRWDYEPPRTERFDRQIYWDSNYRWDIRPNEGWSWDLAQSEAGISFAAPEWISQGIYGRAALMGTADYPGRTIQKNYRYNIAPRIGFAYQALPRTVVRGSYGKVYLTMTGDRFLASAVDNVGFGDFARLSQDGTPDGGLTYPASFSNPLPGGLGYVPFTRDVQELNYSTLGNWFVVPAVDQFPGYEHVAQLNIQREFGSGSNTWVVEVAYNGNFGRKLPFFGNLHSVPNAYDVLGKTLGTNLNKQVTNPFYGQIPPNTTQGGTTNFLGRIMQVMPLWRELWAVNDPLGYSNFNSAYVQIERRFSNGFSFLSNYTFGKALHAGGGVGAEGIHNVGAIGNSNGPPQANQPMKEIYGLSDYDVTHRFLFNYVLELPFGRGKRFAATTNRVINGFIGGWSMAGTTLYRGGQPFSLVCASGFCRNYITIGQGKLGRPSFTEPRVAYDNNVSAHTALEGSAGFTPYFNPDAFQPTTDMEIGTVGSTLHGMRGSGFSQWDFALLKNISLGMESRYLQLRFEGQNIFNQMNPGKPINSLPSRAFGTITTQEGLPRQIMIAAKFYF
ncbi:MAG TPA: TonB-dependent receptor [Bryobacteraceae bacterium]|nr:TonB-dependent receptor [Bryobacteraceae bacterium]